MFPKRLWIWSLVITLLLGMMVTQRAQAGSATVGSVTASQNAVLDGQAVAPNTALFSGDSLEVRDGTAVVSLKGGARMTLAKDTAASFIREADEVTVTLERGSVTLFHPNRKTTPKVSAAGLSIMPATGFKTLGEVAMMNGAVIVTATEGRLRVQGSGPVMEINKGERYRFELPQAAPAGQGGMPAAGNAFLGMGKKGIIITAIAGGAAAATVIYLVVREESPSTPD